MRRMSLALLLACTLGLSLAAQVTPKEWNSESVKSSPAANTILCQYQNENETAESHHVSFTVSSVNSAAVFLEHMNAANDTAYPNHSQFFQITGGEPYSSMRFVVTLDSQERVRVRLIGAVASFVQCSMFVE